MTLGLFLYQWYNVDDSHCFSLVVGFLETLPSYLNQRVCCHLSLKKLHGAFTNRKGCNGEVIYHKQ